MNNINVQNGLHLGVAGGEKTHRLSLKEKRNRSKSAWKGAGFDPCRPVTAKLSAPSADLSAGGLQDLLLSSGCLGAAYSRCW